MKGTIELFTGRTSVHKKIIAWYSKEQCRQIYNLWMEQYEDAVIHIYPIPEEINSKPTSVCNNIKNKQVVNSYNNKKNQVINNTTKDIEMVDFVNIGLFRHETYYHKCYYNGEK